MVTRFLGDVSSLVGKVEIPGFSGKSWKWNRIVSQVDNTWSGVQRLMKLHPFFFCFFYQQPFFYIEKIINLIVTLFFLLQRKNKMGRHCERTVWALGRGHHPSRGKANFQPSVDSSNPGSGNGKRNRINSRLPHCVSNPTFFFYRSFKKI